MSVWEGRTGIIVNVVSILAFLGTAVAWYVDSRISKSDEEREFQELKQNFIEFRESFDEFEKDDKTFKLNQATINGQIIYFLQRQSADHE